MSRLGRIQKALWLDGTFAPVAIGLAVLITATQARDSRANDQGPQGLDTLVPQPVSRVPAAVLPPFRPAPSTNTTMEPMPPVTPGVATPGLVGTESAPGTAVLGPVVRPEGTGTVINAGLAPSVQVVRFHGPPGLSVEVLAPAPSPVPVGDGSGVATVGLERGIAYRLRLSNITQRPGVELFPVIEIVGHLHRPQEIDPAKYPIRVVFSDEELWEVADSNRLVTKVIYLEDPDQAIPLKLPKDQIPVVTVNPAEQPLKVASALGRVMAIVRIGGRRPSSEEINAGMAGDVGLDSVAATGSFRCPFTSREGSPCELPCGPVCGTPPPPGRPWLPKDEYLCDGGDRGAPAGIGGDGGLRGIDPRDAVMKFDVGLAGVLKPRVLPTNRVCIYAPRFAEIRVSTGTNEAVEVHGTASKDQSQRFVVEGAKIGPKRLVHNDAAYLARERRRASASIGRVFTSEGSQMRGLQAYDATIHANEGSQALPAQIARQRAQPNQMKLRIKFDGIKVAESPVMTGLVEGPGQTSMSWRPNAFTAVEVPPDRPGMAIIKRVSATEAEPGDTVTFTITYRNMGNTPIRSGVIVDSLLPRLEYVKGSARGPRGGTVFSTSENKAGSTELKWELPGVIAPGTSGSVEFQAVVR